MAVLTADLELPHKGNPTKVSVPVAGADTWYAGAMVFRSDTGAIAGTAAAAAFIGLCTRNFVTTAALQMIEIYIDGVFLFPTFATAALIDDWGHIFKVPAAVATDNPADLISVKDVAGIENDVAVGLSVGFESTRHWIMLRATTNKYAAAANVTVD